MLFQLTTILEISVVLSDFLSSMKLYFHKIDGNCNKFWEFTDLVEVLILKAVLTMSPLFYSSVCFVVILAHFYTPFRAVLTMLHDDSFANCISLFQLFGLSSSVYIFSALSLYENLPTLVLELLFLCQNNKLL